MTWPKLLKALFCTIWVAMIGPNFERYLHFKSTQRIVRASNCAKNSTNEF